MDNQTNIKRWLVNIWPTIYIKINSFFYWMLSLLRKTFKTAIDQIR
jgi:hypothetical protein